MKVDRLLSFTLPLALSVMNIQIRKNNMPTTHFASVGFIQNDKDFYMLIYLQKATSRP
jgi:hypothetical protein